MKKLQATSYKLKATHYPVLLKETIKGLEIKKGGIYVDCTTNRAGHSIEIAKALGKEGTLICIDLDQDALSEAKKKFKKLKNAPTMHFIHSNFRHLKNILFAHKIKKIDGIIADLGVSSQELDISGRGFTFQKDEKLIMTFNSSLDKETITAYDVINFWDESTIADILYGFADERYARRIAKAIVEHRKKEKIKSTFTLLEIISSAVPSSYRHKKTHFATKTFQALRMAVNDELESIKDLISFLPEILNKNGRVCIITFHSTEDRLVKQLFKKNKDKLKIITKKPIAPTREEIQNNIRSRSAHLRIVEKI